MSRKDYQIDFSAADPNLYYRLFPDQIPTLPSYRDSNPLSDAADNTSVESLAPENLALGQVVPFELRISVDSNSIVNGDTIIVKAGWDTLTTSSGSFGYDGNLGVIAAFIDAADPNASGDTDATVSNFSWALVDTEIQGTFEITNLDPGEEIVLEAWVVLQDEIPEGVTGNVKSRLIEAETAGTVEAGDNIKTGNQTIPLVRVKDFLTSQEDLSVTLSESNVITAEHEDSDSSNNSHTAVIDVVTAESNSVISADNTFTSGVFTVGSLGTVNLDYLYDGGWYRGDLAIFSLQGMEHLETGSQEFLQEAANRALSNSELGYVVLEDRTDRARFSDLNNELSWEGQYNDGIYNGEQIFQMQEGDRFAMMLVTNGTVVDLAANPNTEEVFFSFDTLQLDNGETIGQIADLTGDGSTFGWEDVNLSDTASLDRDYNDLVVQVQGASATTATVEDSIYDNRDWLNTEIGQELLEYANRLQFETGTFTVNSTGKVEFDYLYDGGWYQGELAVFSLKGMEVYEPGSVKFLTEATSRALSNSERGRILISDSTEGAHFSEKVTWENDFNIDATGYQGVQSFDMEAGDELAFMLVQHTTIQDIYQHPYSTSQWGKKVLFSTDINQVAAVDNNGTLAFEDIVISSGNSDYDYNDFIFQVRGLESDNTVSLDEVVNSNRDWRNTSTGQDLLEYANRTVFNEGVFEVGETGEITFDYLYDGGWYQGELAVFSLGGMDIYEPGSDAFIAEATRRALTNSELGYVLAKDRTEGARFTEKMSWENNFNQDPDQYQGIESFTMNPGDKFAFMLVQHTTVWEISDPTKIWQWGKLPLFSIPEANPGGTPEGQMVDIDGSGTYAFEDVRTDIADSDRDYNDFVFQIKGAKGAVSSIDLYSNSDRDWRDTDIGTELLEYTNRALFDEGVFQVGESGEVTIDFLYDGGFYDEAEVGIFSLNGMDMYETGSTAFIEEAINRAQSNSSQGYTVVQDLQEGAKYSADLKWESNFNTGQHQGKQTFLMNPGDTFGLVIVPDGTLDEAFTAPDWAIKKDPLFSMAAANVNNRIQFADIVTGAEVTVIGFEDARLDIGADKDYNDIVLAIEGAQSIGFNDVEDVMASNRNWLNTEVGQEIISYFDDSYLI